jgi:uncharacterized membrane protein
VKHTILAFLIGMVYFTLEGFWRGWTNITMLFIGGVCGFLIGLLNQYTGLKVWQQTILGTGIALAVELISGLLFNLVLGLGLWNYSGMWGNLYGQICPQFALIWFMLTPFAIWLDDFIRWRFYDEGYYYPPWENYWELIIFR